MCKGLFFPPIVLGSDVFQVLTARNGRLIVAGKHRFDLVFVIENGVRRLEAITSLGQGVISFKWTIVLGLLESLEIHGAATFLTIAMSVTSSENTVLVERRP